MCKLCDRDENVIIKYFNDIDNKQIFFKKQSNK